MSEEETARIRIPSELFMPAESAHYQGMVALPVMKFGPDLYTFDSPISWDVDITNTGEALLVEGTCEVSGATACARCGEAAQVSLFGEVEGYFLIEPDEDNNDDMAGDEVALLPEDHVIDLLPLIHAALALDVPIIPLCDDDCKGLCPTCGKNLNEGLCDCTQEDDVNPDNPFAALKGFVVESES